MRAALAVSLVLVLLVAGCGGKTPAPPTAPATGTVEGRVEDAEGLPVPDATVNILLTNRSAKTDAAGGFRMVAVPLGAQRLVATKEGYSTSTRTGDVVPTSILFFTFTLAEARRPTPYNTTLDHRGEILCGLPAGTQCAALESEAAAFRFPVEAGLRGIVLELDWQAPSEGLRQDLAMDLMAATAETCGEKYAGGEGTSVLRLEVAEGFPITGGHQCVLVRPGAQATTMQQGYTLYASLFYHAAPPSGFTAIP